MKKLAVGDQSESSKQSRPQGLLSYDRGGGGGLFTKSSDKDIFGSFSVL